MAQPRRRGRAVRAVLRAVAGAGARGRGAGRPAARGRRRCRVGEDRDDGGAGRVAGGEPGRGARGDPRAHLHPQGRQRAQRAGAAAARARWRGTPDTDADLRSRLAIAQPTVSTYHGYAAALVAEHGLRIGIEPGAGVLGPAMCWGQAATVVSAWTGDMADVPLTLLTTVEDVLALATELGEHDISPAALRAWTCAAGVADRRLRGRPEGAEGRAGAGEGDARPPAGPGGAAAAGGGVRGAQAGGRRDRLRRPGGLRRPHRRHRRRGGPPRARPLEGRPARRVPGHQRRPAADAGGAVRAGHGAPGAGRRRPAAVHLRLAGCLGRHDRAVRPHVPRPARAPGRAAHPGHQLAQRPVGPRRGQRRLGHAAAAGPAAARPRARADRRRAARSPSGCTRPSPRRPRRWPTGWPPAGGATTPSSAGGPTGDRPTVAVLVRARKQLPGIAAALRERGLPVEVVGLGGLLEVPEVSDVVATLTVLVDPTAGDALGRLLTGARWRIGPRDLAALETRAARARPFPAAGCRRRRRGAVEAPQERGSIVEALDDLGGPDAYSQAGYRRLRRLGGGARPPARPAERVAARPRRRGGPHAGPGDRAGQRPRGQPRRRAGPPRRAARRRRGVHRAGRAAVVAGVPRLPARCRGARARAGAGRGRGEPRGGPAAHRALRQGPGVGRRRRPGDDQGPVPREDRHQRLLGQGPGRRARRPAADRPGGAARSCGCPCPAPATRPW